MTKTTATHNGHCQCCGRIQAYTPRGIAKHGYTTEYGFFNGTCPGSDREPLELAADLTDATIASLHAWADEREAEAEAPYDTFERLPFHTHTRDSRGRSLPIVVWLTEAELAEDKRFHASWSHAVQYHRHTLRRKAAQARSQADELTALRRQFHGQPLIARADKAPLHRERHPNYRTAAARAEELKAQGKRDVRCRRISRDSFDHTVTYRG